VAICESTLKAVNFANGESLASTDAQVSDKNHANRRRPQHCLSAGRVPALSPAIAVVHRGFREGEGALGGVEIASPRLGPLIF
jgi:hypothetical protein